MQATETLTLDAWRGYQRDTFPAGSWVYEDGMLRTVAAAERIDLITRRRGPRISHWRWSGVSPVAGTAAFFTASLRPCHTPGRAA